MNNELINEIVAGADSNDELALILSTVKLAIKNRKAEIKAKKTAEVKAELAGMEGQIVTVKAPASFGAPALSGVITRLGDKTFTVQTTAIATTTGKPKNLARSFTDFLGFGDVTAEYVAVEASDDEDMEAAV